MIDAVLSLHTNPFACGIAKFNQALAQRLGVPCDALDALQAHKYRYPLVSVKWAELQSTAWCRRFPTGRFALLWHDAGDPALTTRAAEVHYATEMGCPSTIEGDPTRGTLDVLCFGMAHKFQAPHFERLRDLLARTDPNYTVSLSTAVHEGHPWDQALADNLALMRGLFGTHVRHLGFLADDGLARALRQVQAVALFYEPAARANNTTLWAALDAGTPVITNLDTDSPEVLRHERSVFDLAQLEHWPDAAHCREVRAGGLKAAARYSWERVVADLRVPIHA